MVRDARPGAKWLVARQVAPDVRLAGLLPESQEFCWSAGYTRHKEPQFRYFQDQSHAVRLVASRHSGSPYRYGQRPSRNALVRLRAEFRRRSARCPVVVEPGLRTSEIAGAASGLRS